MQKNMEPHRQASMTEIKILEVPYQWKDLSPNCEYGSEENTTTVFLVHEPSGIKYEIEIPEQALDGSDAAKFRAKSKLMFIHKLHDDSYNLNWEDI